MGVAIGEILTPALGVAISPFPIVSVILMLTSGRGRARGPAFALGWMIGLAAMVGFLLIVSDRLGIEPSDDGPSTAASIVRLLLGMGLLVLATKKWRSRSEGGDTPAPPGWMQSIERANPARAAVLGAGLSGLNPKNLMFNLVAGTAIASADTTPRGEAIAWVTYVLLASILVIGPVAWYLLAPASASPSLTLARHWLIRYSGVMVGMVLVLIGVSQVGGAISDLAS